MSELVMSGGRWINWDGFRNARDLGGLPTSYGRPTRFGAYVRSADPRFVTPDGWRAARDAGIRTIVDLRNADEIGPIDVLAGIERVEVPLDGREDTEFWAYIDRELLDGSPLYYRPFLARKADRCAAVIRAIAGAAPGGVLFHCWAGRDRTGLVSLLLLALAGVEPAAIAADYELSTAGVRQLYAALGEPDDGPEIAALLADRGTTVRDAILAVLDGFDAAGYLRGAGVSAADIATIRHWLLG